MPRTIKLEVFKNEQLVDRRTFSQEVIKLGKLRSSDLYLEDDAVARMHAVLEISAAELRLVDLGSASGTTLNDQRVHKSSAVRAGDSLRLGPFRIEIDAEVATVGGTETVTPTAPPASAPSPVLAPASATAHTAAAIAASIAPVPVAPAPRAVLPVDTHEVESSDRHVAQVVASYGGTILDVQHVGQVRGRRRQAPAWMALGGLMLLAGAAIVAGEISQDWEGYQQARHEAASLGRAAPEVPGAGLSGLGVGLALMGLVPFGLGVVRRGEVGLECYTLGEGHEATFHVPTEGLPDGEAFPLVRRQGDDYVLQFTAAMRGRVRVGDQSLELSQLVQSGQAGLCGSSYACPLARGATAHIEHAGVDYRIASVPRGLAVARTHEADRPFWIYNAASLGVMGGLLALVHLVPEQALAMTVDELSAENRYVGYINQPDLTPEEPTTPEITPDRSEADPGGTGQRHVGAEGAMGKPTAKSAQGLYAMKGPRDAVPTMARDFNPQMLARNAGVLGVLQQQSGHFLASPYGAFAVGNDDDDVWGGLTGTEVGESFGVGGLGLVGTGRGGGGVGAGTIGLGNVGTIGKGGGGGERSGYGRGSGAGFRPRGKTGPRIDRGHAKIRGSSIDKDVIRRIVRNHHNEVRHCYNQGLTRDPNLRGRVEVMFTIGPAGTVPSAAVAESTLKDRSVANCVAKSVRRWRFPKPQSGGTAMVTYPFTFSPG